MDINVLNKANIDNLTELWKKLGALPCSSFMVKELYASSSWPHRYWIDWGTDTNIISDLNNTLTQIPKHCIVPARGGSTGNARHLEY